MRALARALTGNCTQIRLATCLRNKKMAQRRRRRPAARGRPLAAQLAWVLPAIPGYSVLEYSSTRAGFGLRHRCNCGHLGAAQERLEGRASLLQLKAGCAVAHRRVVQLLRSDTWHADASAGQVGVPPGVLTWRAGRTGALGHPVNVARPLRTAHALLRERLLQPRYGLLGGPRTEGQRHRKLQRLRRRTILILACARLLKKTARCATALGWPAASSVI